VRADDTVSVADVIANTEAGQMNRRRRTETVATRNARFGLICFIAISIFTEAIVSDLDVIDLRQRPLTSKSLNCNTEQGAYEVG